MSKRYLVQVRVSTPPYDFEWISVRHTGSEVPYVFDEEGASTYMSIYARGKYRELYRLVELPEPREIN